MLAPLGRRWVVEQAGTRWRQVGTALEKAGIRWSTLRVTAWLVDHSSLDRRHVAVAEVEQRLQVAVTVAREVVGTVTWTTITITTAHTPVDVQQRPRPCQPRPIDKRLNPGVERPAGTTLALGLRHGRCRARRTTRGRRGQGRTPDRRIPDRRTRTHRMAHIPIDGATAAAGIGIGIGIGVRHHHRHGNRNISITATRLEGLHLLSGREIGSTRPGEAFFVVVNVCLCVKGKLSPATILKQTD